MRVLIVDDSATMRRLIRAGLEADRRIRVVGEAASATEAREAVMVKAPDVMTLDVEMPGMDGLEFLRRLMRARPMPVIMFSSTTPQGSDAALRSLSLGAIDCIEKPRFGQAGHALAHLTEMVLAAAQARVGRGGHPRGASQRGKYPDPNWRWNGKWILIGSSTGGVEALETILRDFPDNCPPTLVTQHMPKPFLSSFASRLNATMRPVITIANDGDRPMPGHIYIAPGDRHLVIGDDGATLRLDAGPARAGHRPSVDAMFGSAVALAEHVVAAILTGMGRDGAEEMKALRDNGAICIGQDKHSCVVYGMPRVAREWGAVEHVRPLGEIAAELLLQTNSAKGLPKTRRQV